MIIIFASLEKVLSADYDSYDDDETSYEFEKKIKRAFDPDNIFNPGKIFPG